MEKVEKEELAYIVNYRPSWLVRWGLLLITLFIFAFVVISIYAKDTMIIKVSAVVENINEEKICLEFKADSKIVQQALLTGKISLITQDKVFPVSSWKGTCFHLAAKPTENVTALKNGLTIEIQIESKIVSFINQFGIY